MKAEDVVELYELLQEHGVQLWIGGGWGVDALLKRQTRAHKDLDLFVSVNDLQVMTTVLSERGFVLKEIWSENRWIAHEEHLPLIGKSESSGLVATAFVLKDPAGRELDLHVVRFDEHSCAIPVWNTEPCFQPDAFDGQGVIAGVTVRCLSATTQIDTHAGYELQDKDFQDLQFLHELVQQGFEKSDGT